MCPPSINSIASRNVVRILRGSTVLYCTYHIIESYNSISETFISYITYRYELLFFTRRLPPVLTNCNIHALALSLSYRWYVPGSVGLRYLTTCNRRFLLRCRVIPFHIILISFLRGLCSPLVVSKYFL
jgi:hypothetical protein